MLSFDPDVARQTPQPFRSKSAPKHEADKNDNGTENNQKFSELAHRRIFFDKSRDKNKGTASAAETGPQSAELNRPASLDHANQHNDDRENQQDVYEATQRVRRHHTEQPEDDQDDRDGPKQIHLETP